MSNSLFDVPTTGKKKDFIRVDFNSNLQQEWDRIFDEEYKRVTTKTGRNITTDKSLLKERALAALRVQLGTVSITKDFHLTNKEYFIDPSKVEFDKDLVLLPKEVMITEKIHIDEVSKEFNKSILNMFRTSAFCTVLGG